MANEISITASLSVYKAAVMENPDGMSFVDSLFTMTGAVAPTKGSLAVLITATAIPLGGVVSPGYFIAKNMDATNFIRLMNGSSGAKVVKLRAGQICLFPWDDTATLYAIADTGTCELRYLLLPL